MSVALPPGAAELAVTELHGSMATRACKAPFGIGCETVQREIEISVAQRCQTACLLALRL